MEDDFTFPRNGAGDCKHAYTKNRAMQSSSRELIVMLTKPRRESLDDVRRRFVLY